MRYEVRRSPYGGTCDAAVRYGRLQLAQGI
jgi:hypothetical protein